MKTPREILLQRHQSAEPRLDALRKEIVAEHVIAPQFVAAEEPAPAFSLRAFALKLWAELVLPCRPAWLGMAAVWLVILALHSLPSGEPQLAAIKSAPPAPEVMAALREQSQLRRQLLDVTTPPAARSEVLGPRSEKRDEMLGA